jgi:hypothetical protein
MTPGVGRLAALLLLRRLLLSLLLLLSCLLSHSLGLLRPLLRLLRSLIKRERQTRVQSKGDACSQGLTC